MAINGAGFFITGVNLQACTITSISVRIRQQELEAIPTASSTRSFNETFCGWGFGVMCERGVVRGRGWMMRGMVCSMMPMMRWQMVGSMNETVNWKIRIRDQ